MIPEFQEVEGGELRVARFVADPSIKVTALEVQEDAVVLCYRVISIVAARHNRQEAVKERKKTIARVADTSASLRLLHMLHSS